MRKAIKPAARTKRQRDNSMNDWILRLNPFEMMIYLMLSWGVVQNVCYAVGYLVMRRGGMRR